FRILTAAHRGPFERKEKPAGILLPMKNGSSSTPGKRVPASFIVNCLRWQTERRSQLPAFTQTIFHCGGPATASFKSPLTTTGAPPSTWTNSTLAPAREHPGAIFPPPPSEGFCLTRPSSRPTATPTASTTACACQICTPSRAYASANYLN